MDGADHGQGAFEGDDPHARETERTPKGAPCQCMQCPLHVSMQRLARAAVSQLVYYADGEYLPRPDLLDDLERWQRLHALIAARICPASRRTSPSGHDLDAARALVPEAQFTALREMLGRCAAHSQGDACPLDAESELELFGAW